MVHEGMVQGGCLGRRVPQGLGGLSTSPVHGPSGTLPQSSSPLHLTSSSAQPLSVLESGPVEPGHTQVRLLAWSKPR
jgi:hypothetical protein